MIQRPVVIAILFAALLPAQNNWFDPAMLEQPEVAKAIQSIDEWIRITEIPAPSKQEQTRAEYMRAEMEKLGLADIRVDDMLNVSGVRKGTGLRSTPKRAASCPALSRSSLLLSR